MLDRGVNKSVSKITTFDKNNVEIKILESNGVFQEISIHHYGGLDKIINIVKITDPEVLRGLISTFGLAIEYLQEYYSSMMEK